LGIGLSVVKALVELHGGSVEAQSAGLGRGSQFAVHLPSLAQAPKVERPTAAPSEMRRADLPARVLLVEDNRDIARVMAALVKRCGHEPRIAHDGAEALELAHKFHPHVALLDIGLPGMSGHDLARCLRDDQELRGMRLIALTGYGQDEDRRRSREAGFDEHLTKPISLATLHDVLEHARNGD
jgi:CheY-like chemotaxis protein